MRRTWLGTPCRIFQVFTFQLKEEPYSRRQSFGSIYVLINYFSVHDPSNRERSRSFEASMPHGYEIRNLDWINLLRNLNLGSYCFTDRKLVAEPHHIKVSLSLRCRCRKRSQWGKKQKLIMLNSKFGLKFDGFFLKWNLLFELHCMIQWNPPQIISLLGPFERIIQDLQQMHFLASKVNINTNLTEELTKIASDKGFRISDNQGSGNCMFHALSEQLETVKGIKIENGQLRQSLVQYLRENPKLVSYNEPHT